MQKFAYLRNNKRRDTSLVIAMRKLVTLLRLLCWRLQINKANSVHLVASSGWIRSHSKTSAESGALLVDIIRISAPKEEKETRFET